MTVKGSSGIGNKNKIFVANDFLDWIWCKFLIPILTKCKLQLNFNICLYTYNGTHTVLKKYILCNTFYFLSNVISPRELLLAYLLLSILVVFWNKNWIQLIQLLVEGDRYNRHSVPRSKISRYQPVIKRCGWVLNTPESATTIHSNKPITVLGCSASGSVSVPIFISQVQVGNWVWYGMVTIIFGLYRD